MLELLVFSFDASAGCSTQDWRERELRIDTYLSFLHIVWSKDIEFALRGGAMEFRRVLAVLLDTRRGRIADVWCTTFSPGAFVHGLYVQLMYGQHILYS